MQTSRFYAFIATIFALCVSTHADTVVAHLALDGGSVARKDAPVATVVAADLDLAKGATWKLRGPGALGQLL